MQDQQSSVASPSSSLIDRDCSSSSGGSRKRQILSVADETAEQALVEHVKKCRVSSTPGELRLKKDLVECDQLLHQGIARFDKSPGNPLKCQLTFLCSIGVLPVTQPQQSQAQAPAQAVATRSATVPTTFSIVVPKFYPHEPPLLYVDRCYSRACSFVDENGKLHLPFLSSGEWSSVQTMKCIALMLLEMLQHHANKQTQRSCWGQRNAGATGSWQGDLPWKIPETNPTTTSSRVHNLASLDDRARAETSGSEEAQRARGEGWGVMRFDSGSACAGSSAARGYGESHAGNARATAAREDCFWSTERNESPVPQDQTCCLDGKMDIIDSL